MDAFNNLGGNAGGQPGSSVTHQIIDRQHGIPLAAFDHPADWQAQSQVQWDFQLYSQPVRVYGRAFRAADPSAMVEFFPVEAFCWIEPYTGFHQPGRDAGGGVVLLQPMSAVDALARWVVPKYRGSAPSLRIVGGNALPQLPQMLGATPAQGAMQEGAVVQIEYAENRRAVEEEVFGLKTAYQGVPSYGAAGTLVQYNWGFERLFSIRAAKGELDTVRPVAWSMVRSVRENPQWRQLHAQVMQQLTQQFNQHLQAGYANIESATRLSRQISANNDAWLQNQQQQREAAYQSDQRRQQEPQGWGTYTSNDAFGDYMMGRQTYNDPSQTYGSSQHSGYHNYVWSDGQGNYQYSDDANFNPNVGSNANWTLLQKRQIGG